MSIDLAWAKDCFPENFKKLATENRKKKKLEGAKAPHRLLLCPPLTVWYNGIVYRSLVYRPTKVYRSSV